ncbi:uncharacterized protein CANTADRAFT_27719 [Suhomyces tanzawaensis NRRL Y-17324]|uniref:Chromatin modification-related protein EAF1 n=1 Tax=Suhomyces tanzawaensis NRRL Y-17324 TaxID=984487 RepID=A0A1E4SB13_9ASCO|nr:uncharacterized protein CANTADRAFT_27719 [Suhomyces tanzawaensis NRRL Y-17324]ODV76693.1 hypothetical protein CANTADRAFT_27719 [Suhomyces tanzawaensis NRRL Y-17324]
MTNLDYLAESRLRKLEELYTFINDPLLDTLTSKNEGLSKFLQQNDIENSENFDLRSLLDENGLAKSLENWIVLSMEKTTFHPSQPSKRKADFDSLDDRARKRHHYKPSGSRSSRQASGFNTRQPKKASAVKSLRSQEEVSQEEMEEFLTKDISEVEILSIPEHYPTKPHTVSSLAELYYLTQTLPLIKLLPGSHKVLMTDNFELALLEGKIAVLYSRIEELKRQGKWSLRQPQRFYDPFVYLKKNKKHTYHWDSMVQEGKWMAADFKESSKYKKACCVIIAQAVKDYWVHGKSVCIKPKEIVHLPENLAVDIVKEETSLVAPAQPGDDEEVKVETPSAIEILDKDTANAELATEKIGQDPESIDTNLIFSKNSTADPEVKFSFTDYSKINDEDIYKYKGSTDDRSPFKLHVDLNDLKKIDQSIIKNLPKFSAFEEEAPNGPAPALKPKDTPLIPVSRLLHPFEEDDDWYKIVIKEANNKSNSPDSSGPPEYQKGLFGFQSHRRFNYLKPPKPPLIKNIEYRSPTIWLPQDDKYLIHYVAEFCFNWDLISEHLLSSASTLKKYESNIERRTPWQCFERYIQLNEKFQFSDMKGVYSYHAQQWLEQAHKAQLTTKRRISPLGVGAESIQRGHRRLRWASLFDAIRKCMKKREIAAAKINNRRTTDYTSGTTTSASTATNPGTASANNTTTTTTASNANQSVSSAGPNPATKRVLDRVPTPAELAKLKFERDKSIQEAYLNQQATRSRMMAAVAQQQKQQLLNNSGPRGLFQPGAAANSSNASAAANNSNIGPQQRVPVGVNSTNLPPNSKIGSSSAPAQVSGQAPPVNNQRARPNTLPTANKRPTTPNGTPYTPEQIQQLLQIQKQRRLMQQQNQQNQQVKGAGSPLSNSAMLPNGSLPNKTLANNQNSISNPQIQGQLPQVSNSSLLVQPQAQPGQSAPPLQQSNPQTGSSGTPVTKPRIHFAPAQVSAIINSIQQKNPGFSKEQVTKLAAQYLANLQQQQQERFNQQQQQNRLNQPLASGSNPQLFRPGNSLQTVHKQTQIATLTPQERNQLQMLKAAKTAQQQQLQQQQLQQQLQGLAARKSGSPITGSSSPLDMNSLSKLEYEQRKKAMIQKQQQQQRMSGVNMSPLSGLTTPRMSSGSSPAPGSGSPTN